MRRVYLSSTYRDLIPFRDAALKAIRKSGFDCNAMEDYSAADNRPVDYCINDVLQCNVYVGLFAQRYGFIPPGYDCSITELEYRQAKAKQLPTLVFLLADHVAWSSSFRDSEEDYQRNQKFREQLQVELMADFFTTPEDLATKILASLHRLHQEGFGLQKRLDEGVRLLKQGAYGAANKVFEDILTDKGQNGACYFYRAIARLAGQPPRTATFALIQQVEQTVETAMAIEPDRGRNYALLAVIRHDYYAFHGHLSPSPSAEELRTLAQHKGLKSNEWQEILTLLKLDV